MNEKLVKTYLQWAKGQEVYVTNPLELQKTSKIVFFLLLLVLTWHNQRSDWSLLLVVQVNLSLYRPPSVSHRLNTLLRRKTRSKILKVIVIEREENHSVIRDKRRRRSITLLGNTELSWKNNPRKNSNVEPQKSHCRVVKFKCWRETLRVVWDGKGWVMATSTESYDSMDWV